MSAHQMISILFCDLNLLGTRSSFLKLSLSLSHTLIRTTLLIPSLQFLPLKQRVNAD